MKAPLGLVALSGVLVAAAVAASCGDSAPVSVTAPSVPSNPFTTIKVGTAGNVGATIVSGGTVQLWAVATAADGTTADLTNIALWQSSDPAVATVTSAGLVKTAIEGSVTISATYSKVTGSLDVGVEKEKEKAPIGCAAMLDKPTLVFGAFGTSASIGVTLTKSDCRWTATSNVSWLRVTSTPRVSGTGTFSYTVLDNNTPSARSTQIIVQVTDGAAVVHQVTQERPVSCSYVVSPEVANYTAAGGTGSFEVITTPADCQWRLSYYDFYPVKVTSGSTGTGRQTVKYVVNPYTETYDRSAPITVSGLSGVNPSAVHTVVLPHR